MVFSTNCYIRFFDSTALLFCFTTFAGTAHVSFINGHNGLLRNYNIIKVEVSFLHFLFLFFEILSPLMWNFMFDMWTLSISLIICWNVCLSKIEMCFPDLFDLFLDLFLILSPGAVRVPLFNGLSSLLIERYKAIRVNSFRLLGRKVNHLIIVNCFWTYLK